MSEKLTSGIKYLISKSENTKEQKNYKLITYLSHLEEHDLLPKNRKDVTQEVEMQRSRLISKIKFEDCKGMKEFKHGLD
jgi:hypothetical protein